MSYVSGLKAIGILGTFLSSSLAFSFCEGLKGESHSFCLALKAIKNEQPCDSLSSDRISSQTCLALNDFVHGSDCNSSELLREPLGEFNHESICLKIYAGLSGEKCDAPVLPLILSPFTGSPRKTNMSVAPTTEELVKFCKFGHYIALNHQFVHKRRLKFQLAMQIQEKLKGFSDEFSDSIQKIGLNIYPKIHDLARQSVSVSQLVHYLVELKRTLYFNRDDLVRLAQSKKKSIYISQGTCFHQSCLPSSIQVTPQGQVIVSLKSIQIGRHHVNLDPIGKGTFKEATIAFDFDSGELFARMSIPSQNEDVEKTLQQARAEKEMQNSWDYFLGLPSIFFVGVNSPVDSIFETGLPLGLQEVVMIDHYYPYNLKEFISQVLNNKGVHSIEGHSKSEIKMNLMISLLRQLGNIHRMGVHHRDIKPQNILVDFDNEGLPFARIADAGGAFNTLSVNPIEVQEKEHEQVGSPLYLSPEYARANREALLFENYNLKTDVWAMGLTFWNLLTGLSPRTPSHVFQLIFLLAGIHNYEDLATHLGLDWRATKRPVRGTLEYAIYRMLDPSMTPGHRASAKQALLFAREAQSVHNHKINPAFRFRVNIKVNTIKVNTHDAF